MDHTLPSELAQEPDAAFPYGTIHTELPASSPAAIALRFVQGKISEEDLDGRGLDVGHFHITLRYGIQGDDISAIEALLGAHSPIAATLGPTSSFPPSATREVAVVIATVDSPELHTLYQRLGEGTEFAETIHQYEPHVTVAYVRPEVAEKYVGNQITAGHRFFITEVLIRTRSKNEIIVTLNG